MDIVPKSNQVPQMVQRRVMAPSVGPAMAAGGGGGASFTFKDVMRIFRKRWLTVFVTSLVVGVLLMGAVLVWRYLAPIYKAEAQVMVEPPKDSGLQAQNTMIDKNPMDILIQTEGTPAHLLPTSSMTLNDDGQLGVRIVEDGVVRFVPVRMLRDTSTGVWLAGRPEVADVITVGQEFGTDGVEVRVTYEELTQ